MTNEDLLSRTISVLRFPLIVGVVFIHSRMKEITIQGDTIRFDSWTWLAHTMDFFSTVLPAICVPLFFFISGFLFFYKCDFSKDVYKQKVKRRGNSLLVPYLIWNFIGFLILLIKKMPMFSSIFLSIKDLRIDISVFIDSFWSLDMSSFAEKNLHTPINYPLWYVRDLMILVLFTPIIYQLIKRMNVFLVLLFSVIWFFSLGRYIGLSSLSHQSIFFFPLGAYFSINHINFVALMDKAKWSPYLYAIFAIGDMLTRGQTYNFYFNKLGIISGVVAAFYLASVLIKSEKIISAECWPPSPQLI